MTVTLPAIDDDEEDEGEAAASPPQADDSKGKGKRRADFSDDEP